MARYAVVASVGLVSAQDVQRFIVINKAGDKQVRLAVVVIVKPDGASGPAWRGGASLISDISEGRIPIIAVQNISAITRDVKIHPPIAVVISSSDAHPEGAAGYPGF